MPANFYNAGGSMGGLDLHDYVGCLVPPIPVVVKAFYAVYAAFDGPCADESTRLANVTSSGKPTLQGGFKREHIVHVPAMVPMVPHVLEVPLLGMIYGFSGSTALLKKGSVTGAGKPLAVCISGAGGTNLNCADPFDMPLNVVYDESSVMTEPSAGDFAEAVVSAAGSAVIGKIVGGLFGKLFPGADSLVDPIRKYVEGKIKDQLEKWIDEPMKVDSEALLTDLGFTRV